MAVLLLTPAAAVAQDNTSNQPVVLPDIAPRVVEIRGPLEISFPTLQRQPLVGFNPPPRVVPIPPERRPWVDAYKQTKAELPPSPLHAPEPPAVSALRQRPPRGGEVEGSLGRYFSRLARARIEVPAGTGAAVFGQVDYHGTAGHDPDVPGTTDADASADALDARAGLQASLPGATVGLEADGFVNNYRLYASDVGGDEGGTPSREGTGLGTAVWLRTRGTTAVDGRLRLRYGSATYTTLLPDGTGDTSPFERQERRLSADGALAAPLAGGAEVRLDARAATAGLDAGGFGTVRSVDAMGGLRYRAGRTLDLTAGARVLAYASGDQRGAEAGPSGEGSATYVAPDVRLSVYPQQGVTLYVQNRPGLDENALPDLFRRNPYLVRSPLVRPTLRTLDAEGGLNAFLGPVEVDVSAGYTRAPSYLFFEYAAPGEPGAFGAGLSAARYGRAAILHAGGDVSVVLPAGFNVSAGATFRRGRLLDADGEEESEIPYFGDLVGRAALSFAFADQRGLFQLGATYESARWRDRVQSRRIGDYFDLDATLSYNVAASLGVVARVENVSFGYLERWDRYEQPPFVVMGGFRVLW